jgi:hypothetical protein
MRIFETIKFDNMIEEEIIESNAVKILWFLAASAIAMLLPFFIHIQWITGVVVNALLIIVLFISGIRSALILSIVPSLMALSSGLLPIFLAPIIPFIMLGNIVFVSVIQKIYYSSYGILGYWIGIFLGAALKAFLIFLPSMLMLKVFLNRSFTIKIIQLLSINQFITAIAGGLLAWIFLKWLKRVE